MVGTQIEERKEALCAICLGEEGSVEHESAAVCFRQKWLVEEGGRFVRENEAERKIKSYYSKALAYEYYLGYVTVSGLVVLGRIVYVP